MKNSDRHILTTPITEEMLSDINVGDTIYLTGMMVTCRDDGHRRLVEERIKPKFNLDGMCIIHAGPIVKVGNDGKREMISIGPTTSRRMEKYEKDFIKESGVKIIVGKGGMGADTTEACKEYKALHCIYPGGCAVTAASQVEEIVDLEWEDFGMPEALWVLRVKEFGPLIVSIDTKGNNLFEENKKMFNEKKTEEIDKIVSRMKFGHK